MTIHLFASDNPNLDDQNTAQKWNDPNSATYDSLEKKFGGFNLTYVEKLKTFQWFIYELEFEKSSSEKICTRTSVKKFLGDVIYYKKSIFSPLPRRSPEKNKIEGFSTTKKRKKSMIEKTNRGIRKLEIRLRTFSISYKSYK